MRIPETRFLLREPKSKSKTLIHLVVRYNNNKFVFNAGEKVIPKNWDFKKQRVKRNDINYSDINIWLDKLSLKTTEIFRNYRGKEEELSNDLIKENLVNHFNLKNKTRSNNKTKPTLLFPFIEDYIDKSRKLKKAGTIKVYQSTQNLLSNFNDLFRYNLSWENIDMEFYNDFISYCMEDLEHSSNTVGKYIKTLKVFLNEATERGINRNLTYTNKKFKRPSAFTDKIYLNLDEISALFEINLSKSKEDEYIRDLFVFSCYTGLRYGDLIRVRSTMIENKERKSFLRITTTKTGNAVIIPLNSIALTILKKYNLNFDKKISNQHGNRVLKYLGKLAGINELINLNQSISGTNKLIQYLCAIFKKYGNIPEQPKLIYKKIIRLLIEEWDSQNLVKRDSQYAKLDIEEKQDFFDHLAFYLNTGYETKVYTEFQLEKAYLKFNDKFQLSKKESNKVIEELETHTGLFVKSSYDTFEFDHKSLQEYLTARFIFNVGVQKLYDNLPNEYAIATSLAYEPEEFLMVLTIQLYKSRIENTVFIEEFFSRLLDQNIMFTKPLALCISLFALYSKYYVTIFDGSFLFTRLDEYKSSDYEIQNIFRSFDQSGYFNDISKHFDNYFYLSDTNSRGVQIINFKNEFNFKDISVTLHKHRSIFKTGFRMNENYISFFKKNYKNKVIEV